MKFASIAIVSASALATLSHAGFTGWTAFVQRSGDYYLVDVFAVTAGEPDRMLNIYDSNISTTAAGNFFQAAGNASKTWKPDTVTFTSTRAAIDSFMTIGATRFAGDASVYAGSTTNGDPNFTGTSWNATPASAPANTVPTLAGWYTSDPPNTSLSESLALVSGTRLGTQGDWGSWAGHLVVSASNASIINWAASATVKNTVTGITVQSNFATSFAVPAPGAVAVLGLVGIASSRRRRA